MTSLAPLSPSRLDSLIFLNVFLDRYKRKINIIDVGCGKMFFYKLLVEKNIKGSYFGLDINNPPKIGSTVRLKVRLQKKDVLKVKTNVKYDLVVCLWVLEHIKKDLEAFNKLVEFTKENGILIVALPSIWSWPFEFGKHGYHYYSKKHFEKKINDSDLKIIRSYESGGLIGFLYMIFYNWPRYLILTFSIPIFLFTKLIVSKEVTWSSFSVKLIENTWYLYIKSPALVKLQNFIVAGIVKIDNKLKILPASYIYILNK